MLLAVVLLAQLGYKFATPPDVATIRLAHYDAKLASWTYYVFQAVQDMVLYWLLYSTLDKKLPRWLLFVGMGACAYGVWESFETVVCGLASVDRKIDVPLWSGLCAERFGPWFGPSLAAMATTVVVIRERRK